MEAAALLAVARAPACAAAVLLGVTDLLAEAAAADRGRRSSRRPACGWARRASPRSARGRPRRPSGAPAPAARARPPGATASRSAARSRAISSRRSPRAPLEPSAPAASTAAPAFSSSRSSASSIPSRRWETERSRRVRRSTSAAEGMLSAPIAASWAWTALSRASKALVSARLTTGLAISSSAIRPSASSPWRDRRSTKLLSWVVGHGGQPSAEECADEAWPTSTSS